MLHPLLNLSKGQHSYYEPTGYSWWGCHSPEVRAHRHSDVRIAQHIYGKDAPPFAYDVDAFTDSRKDSAVCKSSLISDLKRSAEALRCLASDQPSLLLGLDYSGQTFADIREERKLLEQLRAQQGKPRQRNISTDDIYVPQDPLISAVSLPHPLYAGDIIEPDVEYFTNVDPFLTDLSYRWTIVPTDPPNQEYTVGDADCSLPLAQSYIGKKVKCEITSATGDYKVIVSEGPVLGVEPVITNIGIRGTPLEGHVLQLVYTFSGRTEGQHQIVWFSDRDIVATQCRTYEVKSTDVNKQISVELTPKSGDGLTGQAVTARTALVQSAGTTAKSASVTSSSLRSVQEDLDIVIAGDLIVDNDIQVRPVGEHHERYDGAPVVKWYRVGTKAHHIRHVDASNPYICHLTDKEFQHQIRVDYTPVTFDGKAGPTQTTLTDEVVQVYAPSVAIQWTDPAAAESPFVGTTLRFHLMDADDTTQLGPPQITWYRAHDVVQQNSYTYCVTEDDIGHPIEVQYTPTSHLSPDIVGETAFLQSAVVRGDLPVVLEAQILGDMQVDNTLYIVAETSPPDSNCTTSWYRITPTGKEVLLQEDRTSLLLLSDDIGCHIKAVVTPLSEHGEHGEGLPVLADLEVRKPIPKVIEYQMYGVPEHNQDLVIRLEEDHYGEPGPGVHSWYRGSQLLDDEHEPRYTCKLEDIGFKIAHKYTPVNCNGVSGNSVSSVTQEPVRPAPTRELKITRLEAAYCGSRSQVFFSAQGDQGSSQFVWSRSPDGSNWTKCAEYQLNVDGPRMTDKYLATADDLNHFIQCTVNVKSGATTKTASAPPRIVYLHTNYRHQIVNHLSKGHATFDVKIAGEGTPVQLSCNHKGVTMTGANIKKNWKWSAAAGLALHEDSSVHFVLHGTKKYNVILEAHTNSAAGSTEATSSSGSTSCHTREFIILVFRAFQGLSTKQIATNVVDERVFKTWHKSGHLSESDLKAKDDTSILLQYAPKLSQKDINERRIQKYSLGVHWWDARVTLEAVCRPGWSESNE